MMRVSRAKVKGRRRYDSSARRRQAEERRGAVVASAGRRFLRDGYATTTVASVAADAGVSVETVYKAFGNKAGLVRALWEQGLAGAGPVPAESRADRASASEADPRALLRRWSELSIEVAPRFAPVMLLVRAAAATDPEMASLLAEIEAQRRDRMAHNAAVLARHLREGVTLDRARDVLLAYTAPELFELLVLRQEWPVEEYAEFGRRGIAAQLL
jgi:AcrR family transcriptional regulator